MGKSPPLSTLPACEDCVGALLLKSDGFGVGVEVFVLSPVMETSQAKVAGEGFGAGDGAAVVVLLPVIGPTPPVTGSSSLVTFEVGMVPSSDFGLSVVNIAKISSMTLIASASPVIIPLIPERGGSRLLRWFLVVGGLCRLFGAAGHWGSGRVVCAGKGWWFGRCRHWVWL